MQIFRPNQLEFVEDISDASFLAKQQIENTAGKICGLFKKD
jgi:hypothetical protein